MIYGYARGSVQQRLNQETLKDVLVPFIDSDVQIKIKDMIRKSRKLEIESREMLNRATCMVEIAIEQGEKIALQMWQDSE